MKKTKITKLLAVLLVVCMMTTSVVGGTLAAYTSEVTGTGTVTVAKWGIGFENNLDGGDAETVSQDFTISVADTKDENKLVFWTDDGTNVVAPGDKGSFDLGITDSGTEVAYAYSIKIENANKLPIKFYTEKGDSWSDVSGIVQENETLPAELNNQEICWEWVTVDDETDTDFGDLAAAGKADYTFNVTMSATQLIKDVNYLEDYSEITNLTADSNAVYYIDNIDQTAAVSISNENYTGKIIFGNIESDSTISIDMPKATVEVGDLTASGAIDIKTGQDTFVLKGESKNTINILGGNVKVQPTANVQTLTIASGNTTTKKVEIEGAATLITNAVADVYIAVGEKATVTTITSTETTYVSNKSAAAINKGETDKEIPSGNFATADSTGVTVTEGTAWAVSDEASLRKALEVGGEIVMINDINVKYDSNDANDSDNELQITKDTVLDGGENKYRLTRESDQDSFITIKVKNAATVTIKNIDFTRDAHNANIDAIIANNDTNCTVEGCIFKNIGEAIHSYGGTLEVKNNIFDVVTSGVVINEDANVVSDIKIDNNKFSDSEYAVYTWGNYNVESVEIDNNTFDNCKLFIGQNTETSFVVTNNSFTTGERADDDNYSQGAIRSSKGTLALDETNTFSATAEYPCYLEKVTSNAIATEGNYVLDWANRSN